MLDFKLMAKPIDKLSVFFPAYNEEYHIKNTIEYAVKVLEKVAYEWEVIVINDGSNDKTLEIANKMTQKDRRIRVVNHKKNRGYGAAFKSGFYNAKYSWIAFTDADGQFDFSEIKNFIDKQKETRADLVIGYYRDRKVSLFRKFNTFLWEMLVFLLFGLKVHDIDCGFKLVSKKVIDTIPMLESERGAFVSSEFLIKAKKSGFKIVEVPITHFPRKRGKGTGADINVILRSFLDLARLWKKLQ